MTKHDAEEQKKLWDDLWEEATKARRALEAGIRGGVSDERRKSLEDDFKDAHRRWWDSVSNFQG